MKRKFHLDVCALQYDWHMPNVKACKGKIEALGGYRLCARHRALVRAIERDANRGQRRHPVRHKGHQEAA